MRDLAPSEARDKLGEKICSRYAPIARLGGGSMAVVYRAFDPVLGSDVALKVLDPHLRIYGDYVKKFAREAEFLFNMNHPNIVRVFSHHIPENGSNDVPYISMEFVDGIDLKEMLRRSAGFSLSLMRDYLRYMVQVCNALDAIHLKNVVHRDVKPSNIMITSEDRAKLTDFGIMESFESPPEYWFTIGAPLYMGPEQVGGSPQDGRTDIYSVGVVLYELFTGQPPFSKGNIELQHLNEKPRPPTELAPLIPECIESIIMKCLEKDPDERFQGARELGLELTQALEEIK